MSTRVLHVSDLHFGRNDKPESIEALGRLVEESRPELVIASGDLDPPRPAQPARARGGLPPRARAAARDVPGNHDIPYTFPKRFTRPWHEFERLWETTEPVYRSDGVVVAGLNSVRPWRHQSGRLRDAQVQQAAETFAGIPTTAYRIVAFHHHLLGAPWRSRKKPVAKRNRVLAGLVEAGADLILAGHIHQSTVAERREFELSTPRRRACRRRLDRARLRPAPPEPPRRGPRPPSLRDRGGCAAHPHVHLARGRLGAHGRAHVPARPRASRLRVPQLDRVARVPPRPATAR